jgi:hypothetical protein
MISKFMIFTVRFALPGKYSDTIALCSMGYIPNIVIRKPNDFEIQTKYHETEQVGFHPMVEIRFLKQSSGG